MDDHGKAEVEVRGRIDPRISIGAGAPACLRRQVCSCPSQSDVLSHAWCQACVELCLLGREGSMLGSVIVSCIMPWRSSFPYHRMCCGPDTLLWQTTGSPALLYLSFGLLT